MLGGFSCRSAHVLVSADQRAKSTGQVDEQQKLPAAFHKDFPVYGSLKVYRRRLTLASPGRPAPALGRPRLANAGAASQLAQRTSRYGQPAKW